MSFMPAEQDRLRLEAILSAPPEAGLIAPSIAIAYEWDDAFGVSVNGQSLDTSISRARPSPASASAS